MNEPGVRYQLSITRLFAARAPAVYQAFVDPAVLANWLPAAGWRMPADQVLVEPSPGGMFRYTMIDKDDPARRVTTSAQFDEVADDRLLSWTETPAADAERPPAAAEPHHARLELGKQTRRQTWLDLRQGPFTWDEEIAARAWWNSAFSRLDTALAAEA